MPMGGGVNPLHFFEKSGKIINQGGEILPASQDLQNPQISLIVRASISAQPRAAGRCSSGVEQRIRNYPDPRETTRLLNVLLS